MVAQVEKQAGSSGGALAPLALILVLGVGSGFGYGFAVGRPSPVAPAASDRGALETKNTTKTATAADGEQIGKGESDRLKEHIIGLEAMIVNVGGAAGNRLRLEGAVAFAQPPKDGREALLAQLSEDVMRFVRSTNLAQLQTAAGLEFLKDDLSEIVQLRSKGRARRFIIRTLVVE